MKKEMKKQRKGIGEIMKEYIERGKVIDIVLDNDKVVKVATDFIDKMMTNLDIDKEEALLTWLEDEEYLVNDEQEELTNQAKANKSVKIIDAKAKEAKPEKKTQKERVRKENPTKEMIISEIAKLLPNFAENVNIENAGKLITFTIGEDEFKIDLVQKRKKKN